MGPQRAPPALVLGLSLPSPREGSPPKARPSPRPATRARPNPSPAVTRAPDTSCPRRPLVRDGGGRTEGLGDPRGAVAGCGPRKTSLEEGKRRNYVEEEDGTKVRGRRRSGRRAGGSGLTQLSTEQAPRQAPMVAARGAGRGARGAGCGARGAGHGRRDCWGSGRPVLAPPRPGRAPPPPRPAPPAEASRRFPMTLGASGDSPGAGVPGKTGRESDRAWDSRSHVRRAAVPDSAPDSSPVTKRGFGNTETWVQTPMRPQRDPTTPSAPSVPSQGAEAK